MDRAEFQQLAEDRVLDAEALLATGRWSAAYHLAGYAVECGLKSCVLAYLEKHPEVVFQIKRYSERCWTHKIDELLELAGLKAKCDTDAIANSAFAQNWLTVKSWSEVSRYQQKSQPEAKGYFVAVTQADGVLPWIRTHW